MNNRSARRPIHLLGAAAVAGALAALSAGAAGGSPFLPSPAANGAAGANGATESVPGLRGSPRSGTGPAALAALREQAGRQGSVRVLVELEPDAALEGLDRELFGELAAPDEVLAGARARRDGAAPGNGPRRLQRDLPAAAVAARSAAIARLQERLLARIDRRALLRVQRYTHSPVLALEVGPAALEVLAARAEVRALRVDGLRRPQLASTLPVIGAQEAWALGATGAGQTVAVLDTGVDGTHGFLAGKVIAEACFSTTYAPHGATALCQRGSTAPGAAAPCSGISSCDHGTHVAGIVAGQDGSSSGVAPAADLLAIQVFSRFDNTDYCGSSNPCVLAYDSDILAALDHVFGLRDSHAIAAANLSLGGGAYKSIDACDASYGFYKDTLNALLAAGIAPVISSGNGSKKDALAAPGCLSNAVTVGGTSDSDGVASWSNSASWLDFLAPGVSVRSSLPGGGFGNKSGTSMAAPHVAGAIAALRSVSARASLDSALAALGGTAIPVTDTRNGFIQPRIQLDAAAAAAAAPQAVLFLSTLDDPLASVQSGSFQSVTSTQAYGGTARVTSGAGVDVLRFTPTLAQDGTYRIALWYPAGSNYSDRAAVDIGHAAGSTSLEVDQRSGGGRWVVLGDFVLDPALPAYLEISDRNGGTVVADAARFEYVGPSVAPLLVATESLPEARVGEPYAVQLQAQGGVAPYRWSLAAGQLPEGLVLDADSGEIRGLPTLADARGFSVQVTDAALTSATQALGLTTTAAEILFAEDFEDGTLSPWSTLKKGAVVLVDDALAGHVLRKTTNNDPNGGWAPLSAPVGDFELTLHTRKVSTAGGGALRYSLTDAAGNGYGLNLAFSGGTLILERRDAYKATELARSGSLAGGLVLGEWVTLRLVRQGEQLTAELYRGQADPAMATADHRFVMFDGSYGNFTQVNVHGGYEFDTDNLRVALAPPPPPPAPAGALFEDDFEDGDLGPWSPLRSGAVTLVQDAEAGWVLRKTTNNDPAGGWAPLNASTADFSLTLHTRKVNTAGGALLRYSLTDPSGNGYGISLAYSGGSLVLERRDAWKATELARSPTGLPGGLALGDWHTLRLIRQDQTLTAQVYVGRVDPALAEPTHTITAADPAHVQFTQVNINGGHEFDTDDLRVH